MIEQILIENMQTLFQIGIEHIGSKVQFKRIDCEDWTVPIILTHECLNLLWKDYSVEKVLLTELVISEPDDSF